MGFVAAGAGITFGLALGCLGAFFAAKNERFDRIAEWLFVAFGILSVPTMLTVGARLPDAGVITTALTGIGVVGAVGTALGELVVTLRLVDFRRISALLTLAFVAFLAWIGGISLLIVTGTGFPTALGWLGIIAIIAGIGTLAVAVRQPGVITGDREPGQAQMAGIVLAMVGVVIWMVWLAANL